jgi:hypothetical protein
MDSPVVDILEEANVNEPLEIPETVLWKFLPKLAVVTNVICLAVINFSKVQKVRLRLGHI